MKDLIAKDVERHFPDDWSDILEDLDVGPGASIASHGRNSFLEKLFLNPLTTTSPPLLGEYLRYISIYPSWMQAELRRQSIAGVRKWEIVRGSKLSTVRKNSRIDRTICTEPSLNMMFQLALGRKIDRLSARYGYNKALQPDRNRALAKLGSMNGGLATIDLTSASDRISMKMLEWLLPARLFAALLDCRSPETFVDGKWHTLHMISSMGNGFTFSLMTYVFCVLLKAVCICRQEKFTTLRGQEFGVFGDDIICPTHMYEDVIDALKALGHLPNLDKSFSYGYFRESCGGDYWCGVDIRGVYLKRLKTIQDRFSLINRLNRWSARHGVPIPDVVGLLKPPRWREFAVPSYESDVAGIHCPTTLLTRIPNRYKLFVPLKKVISLFVRGTDVLKDCFDNPSGVILAASAARLVSEGVLRRTPNPRYRRITKRPIYWESPSDLGRYGVNFVDWRGMTYVNLT
jgi:hypothetical protein